MPRRPIWHSTGHTSRCPGHWELQAAILALMSSASRSETGARRLMNSSLRRLQHALQYGVAAMVVLSSILCARLLCDTAAWRWQTWYFAPPTLSTAPGSSVSFEQNKIMSRDDLIRFMSLWQGLRDDYSPSKATTDLRDNVIPIGRLARLAMYTDEALWPLGFLITCTAIAGVTLLTSCWLGMRISAERAPFRAVIAPLTPSLIMSTSLTCLAVVPFSSLVAWYLTLDRAGVEIRHGSNPYTLPTWHAICWTLTLTVLTAVVLRSRHARPVAQATINCASCGYPSEGLLVDTCPECGKPFSTRPARRASVAFGGAKVVLICICTLLALRGTLRIATWAQAASIDVAGPTASPFERLFAWAMLAPAAPVSWKATPLGALIERAGDPNDSELSTPNANDSCNVRENSPQTRIEFPGR
jgi:hypothetical protein